MLSDESTLVLYYYHYSDADAFYELRSLMIGESRRYSSLS
jgi:hypothetical protein